jgi:hypothetical protein
MNSKTPVDTRFHARPERPGFGKTAIESSLATATPNLGLALFDPLSTQWATSHIERRLPDQARSLERQLPKAWTLRLVGEREGDRRALFEHWMSLGTEGLRERFFHAPGMEFLANRANGMDFETLRAVGAFDPAGILVCVGEWALLEEPSQAEAAFSTTPSSRRRGLATLVARACAIDAQMAGATRLRVDTLKDNGPAKALAASLNARFGAMGWGDVFSSWIEIHATHLPAHQNPDQTDKEKP